MHNQIIAWRYSPPEAKDDKFDENIPLLNQQLRREYLLKFTGWGFRHVSMNKVVVDSRYARGS